VILVYIGLAVDHGSGPRRPSVKGFAEDATIEVLGYSESQGVEDGGCQVHDVGALELCAGSDARAGQDQHAIWAMVT
jgi:hypothetical protein